MAALLCVCLSLTVVFGNVTSLPMENRQHVHNASLQSGRDIKRTPDAVEREPTYPCGEDRCVCQGVYADCSQAYLPYFPQLPSAITHLDFSHNSVKLNVTEDVFMNITGVAWIDLSSNRISDISSDAFGLMTNLTCLDMDWNPLTCDGISVVLNIPSLEMFTLGVITDHDCERLEDLEIKTPRPRLRDLKINTLTFLNLRCLSPFTGLRRVRLRRINTIVNFYHLHAMPNLTYLEVFHPYFSGLFCNDLAAVFTIPFLKVLNISIRMPCHDFPYVNNGTPVPSLEELNLGETYYDMLNLTHLLPFTGLKRLHLNKVRSESQRDFIVMYKALHQLKNLTYLDVSYKTLSCDDLLTVLTIPSLEELKVRQGTVCTKLVPDGRWPNTSLPYLNTTRLSTLDLSHNELETIVILPDLDELQHVDLSYNKIHSIYPSHILVQLHVLNVRRNSLSTFTETCMNDSSLFPSLRDLDLSQNNIMHKVFREKTVCLPDLQALNARENDLIALGKQGNTFKSLNRLQTLDISDQKIYVVRNGSFTSSLKALNLANDHIRFTDQREVDSDIFVVCSNLANLSLANNDFTGITEKRFQLLLGHLRHLKHMSLRSTGFSYISVGMFQGLISLQFLDLSQNSLAFLPDAAFQSLPSLVSFNLSFNMISVIKKSVFSFATLQRLRHVDLSSNPFTCSCDVLWFQKWLFNSPSVFAGSSSKYKCGNLLNTPVQSFFMQEQACLFSPETSKFIIATISLVFTGMSLLSFLYRYRWHIRLVLHEVFRGPGERQRHLREHHFEYDVFVSYDSNDFFWVRDYLMPSLEGRMGLRLCIHQRDFIPGYPIAENIMDSVKTSKKLLMLFSRSFARRPWCQFELQLGLSHAMDTQDVLIVVMLEDIPPRELMPAMMAVMKTTTYIQWADDDDARDSFWHRMRLALHEILPAVRGEYN